MYFFKRLITLPVLLLIVGTLAFLLVRMAPGGPFDGQRDLGTEEAEVEIRRQYNLDQPIHLQYSQFLKNLLKGDLGLSLKYRHHTVNEIIGQGLPISMALGCLAFLVALGLGIPLGALASIRQGQWSDYLISAWALSCLCIPSFVIGPLLVLTFAIELKWAPVALWGSPIHAILPVLTLGLFFAGRIVRLMKEGTATALTNPYVRTAKAKGLRPSQVFYRHILPTAVLPVVSYSGPLLAELLTGSFVVENLFRIPGIGVFMVNGSINRDYTLIVGLVVLYAAVLILLNLIVDALYAWIDPRVRYD